MYTYSSADWLSSSALPTVSSLTYDTQTLTCTSTGSPATTVTWTKDGDTLTVDGTTYSMTQNVTDRRTSTYENVLTLPATGDISGNYRCQVGNALGDSQMTLTVIGKTCTSSKARAFRSPAGHDNYIHKTSNHILIMERTVPVIVRRKYCMQLPDKCTIITVNLLLCSSTAAPH